MSATDPSREPQAAAVFLLDCDWTAGTGTTLHKHAGWELALVRRGELRYVLDGRPGDVGVGGYLELPAGSVHALWADADISFTVIGQQGLGLTVVVPDGRDGTKEVPVFGREGPWAQEPPRGASYTAADDLARLRRESARLVSPRR